MWTLKYGTNEDFLGVPVVKTAPASAGDAGSLVKEDPTCCGAAKPAHHSS